MDESPPAPPPVQIHHPLSVTVLFKQLSLLKCYSERGGARLLFHQEVSDDGNQTLGVFPHRQNSWNLWRRMEKHVCSYERVRAAVAFLTSREQSGFCCFWPTALLYAFRLWAVLLTFTSRKLGTAGHTVHRNDVDIKVNRLGNQQTHGYKMICSTLWEVRFKLWPCTGLHRKIHF